MGKNLGTVVHGGLSVTYTTDGSASPGDVVALTTDGNGNRVVTQAGGDDGAGNVVDGNVIGVMNSRNVDSPAAGDAVSITVSGIVIANVAGGLTAGSGVAASLTEGQLGSGSDLYLHSDTAGNYRGSLPANGAAVKI